MRFFNIFKIDVFLVLVLCIFVLTACAVKTPVGQIFTVEASKNLKYENIIFRVFKANPMMNRVFMLM